MGGRTVRVYMADGTAFGVQHAEIFNRTIQALSFPRSRYSELKEWVEAKSPGVYFLFGKNENDESICYIGEAQNVFDRISNHVREKDFWKDGVIFSSKDENINSKYLEARLIEMAVGAARYKLDNAKIQVTPKLSRADRDAMEEIIADVRLILGMFGHKLLEPVSKVAKEEVRGISDERPIYGGVDRSSLKIEDHEFSMSVRDLRARGKVTDEGFVVLAGSFSSAEVGALQAGYINLRDKLIADGSLAKFDNHFKFTKDVLFNSPSAAAAVIAGTSRNGRKDWASGKRTLSDLENEISENLKKENSVSQESITLEKLGL